MKGRWLDPDDSAWRAFLEKVRHDVYHLPEYLEVSAGYEGGRPRAFLAEAGDAALLVPLLLRDLPEDLGAPSDLADATSPYGYPSPLFSGDTTPEDGRALVAAFREAASEIGLVSLFLRLHPLLGRPSGALESAGTVVTHGPTVVIDLRRSRDEMWSQTRSRFRTDINKLRRLGFEVAVDGWERYDDFQHVYDLTMERAGASDFYRFSRSYFRDLRERLGPTIHLASVLSPAGDYAGGALLTAEGDIVQYHLGGTNPEFYDLSPSKLMFDVARGWGKEKGYRWFHLGGGVGGSKDSLFHFKAGFSPDHRSFETCRIVVDEGRYAGLNERSGAEGAGDEGFFPLYRASAGAAAQG